MNNQLASAMATIALTAILLMLALFHVERIHTPSSAGEHNVRMQPTVDRPLMPAQSWRHDRTRPNHQA
jgi:hypothetical protein